MGLGFSFGAAPVPGQISSIPQQAINATLQQAVKPQSIAKDFALLARTAAVAAQLGTANSFFQQLNTNRFFVSRMALFSAILRDDDTFDKKRERGIFRKLKTEKSEPSNNNRPQ